MVDSRAAEPPSRTTTGLVGGDGPHEAEGLQDTRPVAVRALRARAAAASPELGEPPDCASLALGVTAAPPVAWAEHAAASAATRTSATTSATGDVGTTVTGTHWPLPEVQRDSSMEDAPAACAVRARRGGCRVARQPRESPGGDRREVPPHADRGGVSRAVRLRPHPLQPHRELGPRPLPGRPRHRASRPAPLLRRPRRQRELPRPGRGAERRRGGRRDP